MIIWMSDYLSSCTYRQQSFPARHQFHPIARSAYTSVAYCVRVRGAYTRTGVLFFTDLIVPWGSSCERKRQPAGNVTLALPHRCVVHIMRRLLYAARATLLSASCRHPIMPTALLREPSTSFSLSVFPSQLPCFFFFVSSFSWRITPVSLE